MGLMLWRRIPVISSRVSASNSTTTSYGPTTSRTIPPGMIHSLSTTSCILSGSTLIKTYAFADIGYLILRWHRIIYLLRHHQRHHNENLFSAVSPGYSTRPRY